MREDAVCCFVPILMMRCPAVGLADALVHFSPSFSDQKRRVHREMVYFGPSCNTDMPEPFLQGSMSTSTMNEALEPSQHMLFIAMCDVPLGSTI